MLWLLPLFVAVSSLAVYCSPWRSRYLLASMAGGTMLVSLALAAFASGNEWTGELSWSSKLHLRAGLDAISSTVLVTVPAIGLPVVVYAAFAESGERLIRLVSLLIFFVGAMMLLVIADDFLTLIVGWELVGACSWLLIAHDRRVHSNANSATFAFLMTRFGDLGLFVAAAAAFAGTRSFAFATLPEIGGPWLHVVAGGVLLSAAAKSGQLPFSIWLFRAMAGPVPVSALLHAATMVAAGAYLLARLEPQLPEAEWLPPAVIAIGLVTALAGGIVAILHLHAKKVLAASTSAHYGLMFVAIGAGYPVVAMLHFVAHAFLKALLFLSAGMAGHRSGSFHLHGMKLGRELPLVAGMTGVGALALAGIPPLGGAWTKEAIGAAAGEVGHWTAIGVIVAGSLSACYAARFQLLAYGAGKDNRASKRPEAGSLAALGWLAAVTVLSTLVWIPPVETLLEAVFQADIPKPKSWETAASLALVAIGLYAGRALAATTAKDHQVPNIAEWFGLPALLRHSVTVPVMNLSLALAAADRKLDQAIMGVARSARLVSLRLGRADDVAVDRGAQASAAFAQWLATASGRTGERVVDGLPELSARLAGAAGRDVRRLQTGLSHHYYVIVAAGTCLLAGLMFMLFGS